MSDTVSKGVDSMFGCGMFAFEDRNMSKQKQKKRIRRKKTVYIPDNSSLDIPVSQGDTILGSLKRDAGRTVLPGSFLSAFG